MIMICVWTITLDDYTETAKITKLVPIFLPLYIIDIVK